MYKAIIGSLFCLLVLSSPAKATCSSYPYTLTNGTTADATQVMADLNCAALTANSTIDYPTFTNTVSLGVGTPYTWGPSFNKVIDIGTTGAITTGAAVTDVHNNLYYNGTNWIYKTSDYGQFFRLNGNTFYWYQAPSGTAGSAATISVTMSLDSSGNLTLPGCLHYNGGTSGTCASDERVKRNIRPFTSVGLAQIAALTPISYSYNGEGGTPNDVTTGAVRTGLLAQDVEKVAPSLTTKVHRRLKPDDPEETALLEVKYGDLTFGLINAVKELKAANDNQAEEIAQLKSQVTTLQRKIDLQTAAK